jgi:hypothetical protein
MPRIRLHDIEVSADHRRQIDLVDHQKVRPRDTGVRLSANATTAVTFEEEASGQPTSD